MKKMDKLIARTTQITEIGDRAAVLRRRCSDTMGSRHITDGEMKFWEHISQPIDGEEPTMHELNHILNPQRNSWW